MPVNFGTGFNITAKEPVDKRLVLTKIEMVTERYLLTGATIAIPDNYFCLCVDDNRLYVYNSGNPVSPETGKFKLESGITSKQVLVDGQTYNYLLKDGLKVQVDSALTDGSGENISEKLSQMQPLITITNKLGADLVDDVYTHNKFVTLEEKNYWNSKQGALPAGQNDTFLHKHKDTGDIEWAREINADIVNDINSNHKFVSTGDIQRWDGKQDKLPSGPNDTFLHKDELTGNLEWVPAETIHIDIDDYLSPVSTNPVQNKVIYEALQNVNVNTNTYSCGNVPINLRSQLADDIRYKRAIIVSDILFQYQKYEVDSENTQYQYATFQSLDWNFKASNLIFKFIVVRLKNESPEYIDQYNVSITNR